ncbi:MAG: disulfide bond formation protein B [Alphaproteobacteria bacterium]
MNDHDSRPGAALSMAWLIALTATLGAIFIGEVMGRTPCVLCWYQRIAMFPLALVLGIAAWRNDGNVTLYALPLSVGGGLVALWHSLLFIGVIPEKIQPCTADGPSCAGADQTIFGMIPLPFLSLAAFAAIVFLLIYPRLKRSS